MKLTSSARLVRAIRPEGARMMARVGHGGDVREPVVDGPLRNQKNLCRCFFCNGLVGLGHDVQHMVKNRVWVDGPWIQQSRQQTPTTLAPNLSGAGRGCVDSSALGYDHD